MTTKTTKEMVDMVSSILTESPVNYPPTEDEWDYAPSI